MSIFPTEILLAIDGSKESELASRTAADLAKSHDSKLHVVYVEPAPPMIDQFADPGPERATLESQQLLDEQVKHIEEAGCTVTGAHLRLGRPDEQIVLGIKPSSSGQPTDPRCQLVTALMLRDGLRYLPDNILTKVDRASMAVGLEVRSPMLDHRVAEFAARLPLALKIHAGEGKWPLRTLLKRYLPRQLVERPKAGFDVPIGSWLRGPLREWAENLLDARRLGDEGYLVSSPIRAKWAEHLSGRRDWQHQLWAVLMFEAWLDAQRT